MTGRASAQSCYIRNSMSRFHFWFGYFWFSPRTVAGEAIER
jgi:hypothetical protein